MATPSSIPESMRAVVIHGPFNVKLETLPVPTIKAPTDALIKVHMAGLCGSDLHAYRGHEEGSGYIMGHEVVGTIVALGDQVKSFKIGDKVLAPFSVSCGSCFYCNKGYTSRCTRALCLTGGQAEYFLMPLAESSLFHLPPGIPEDIVLLLTDILPTGYSAAMNARRLAADEDGENWSLDDVAKGGVPKKGVAVVVGCGPVGLCAITSALTLFETVFATDLHPARLALAAKHGAIALPFDQVREAILSATEGRGADAVLEVVGHGSALLSAIELSRPYGVISSVGVHNLPIEISGATLYDKKTFFPLAMKVLKNNLDLFAGFIEHRVDLAEAEKFYELFEQNKVAKTVFVMRN